MPIRGTPIPPSGLAGEVGARHACSSDACTHCQCDQGVDTPCPPAEGGREGTESLSKAGGKQSSRKNHKTTTTIKSTQQHISNAFQNTATGGVAGTGSCPLSDVRCGARAVGRASMARNRGHFRRGTSREEFCCVCTVELSGELHLRAARKLNSVSGAPRKELSRVPSWFRSSTRSDFDARQDPPRTRRRCVRMRLGRRGMA